MVRDHPDRCVIHLDRFRDDDRASIEGVVDDADSFLISGAIESWFRRNVEDRVWVLEREGGSPFLETVVRP